MIRVNEQGRLVSGDAALGGAGGGAQDERRGGERDQAVRC